MVSKKAKKNYFSEFWTLEICSEFALCCVSSQDSSFYGAANCTGNFQNATQLYSLVSRVLKPETIAVPRSLELVKDNAGK